MHQQLVTECTDRILGHSVPGYRVYRPDTGYTALYSLSNPTGYRTLQPGPFIYVFILGRQTASIFNIWLQPTGYRVYRLATQPALNSLLHINRLQNLPAYYQPAPKINQPTGLGGPAGYSSSAIYLLYKAHQPVTSYTVFTEQFCFTPASYRDKGGENRLLSGAITVLPLFNTFFRGPEPTSRPTWGSPS